MDSELIDIALAARLLGVTRRTLYRRIDEGLLRAVKDPVRKTGPGSHQVFREDVERLLRERDERVRILREARPDYRE